MTKAKALSGSYLGSTIHPSVAWWVVVNKGGGSVFTKTVECY